MFYGNNEVLNFFLKKKWGTVACYLRSNPANVISAVKTSSASFFLQKIRSASLFLQKKWSVSLFLQKKMKRLIISSATNEMPHYYLRKKWGASLFLQKKPSGFFSEEIMRRLIFSEEIMRHFIFFWRSNDALGLVTSMILLTLFLQ